MNNRSDLLFTQLVQIRTELDFFTRLVKYGILDSTAPYVSSLMTLAVKIDVILHKNDWSDKDLLDIQNYYMRFNLVLLNFYNSLRKEN